MTTIYLCRHAIAAEPTGKTSDADRPLTPEGIRKFRQAARGFFHIINPQEVTHILTSPLLHRRQTADILIQTLRQHHRKITPQITPTLGTSPSLPRMLKEIRASRSP